VKLIYQGPLNAGSTSLQRLEAFARLPELDVVSLDTEAKFGIVGSLYERVRWKLRLPVDVRDENSSLERMVTAERPDVVFIDNSRVVRRSTLRRLRSLGAKLVYYTPDDIISPHNLSWPLRLTFPEWDMFFTTKSFNVPELADRGVRRPVLIGKAFDPKLHRPMTAQEVGEEFERYDLVFMGHHEFDRRDNINKLAEAGFSLVVYGGVAAGWQRSLLHPRVVLRDAKFAMAYTRGMHHGKIALCFLRKMNRDRITQRTMEIAAMQRPMLGEKTEEHDAHFEDNCEYVGFSSQDELVVKARSMLENEELRLTIARNAAQRCWSSGYTTDDRARQMLAMMQT
jgi:spore maturation protein CgeB